MKLVNKNFTIKNIQKITVEIIENFILNAGFIPVRWAVVEIKNNDYTVHSTCIRKY